MVFLYYDNPGMLAEQIKCWNSYVGVLSHLPAVLLVDDGSPLTSAASVVKQLDCQLPLKVFRIQEDIPWNFSGARNLGCWHADEWIYVSDIDTLLYPDDAKKLFEAIPLQKHRYYMPKRVWLPDLNEAEPGIVNLLFHKAKFLEIGGYDEDYAGHYGREETDFLLRLRQTTRLIYRGDVLIRVMPSSQIPDANTQQRLRDRTWNGAIFEKKKSAGFLRPAKSLRFSWERVL